MEECNSKGNNMEPLAIVSSEIVKSEQQLSLLSLCIKAQQDLAHKLRKDAKRRQQENGYMRHCNMQLEAEIRNAERSMQSMSTAHETVRKANVDLKKQLLLKKDWKLEILERIKTGEKKYEDLWLECKKRYESLPLVQKLLRATGKVETLQDKISFLENEAGNLQKAIKSKKAELNELDKKQIISLAEFFVHEKPNKLDLIKEKFAEIVELEKDIETIRKEKEAQNLATASELIPKLNRAATENDEETNKSAENWPNIGEDKHYTSIMPKLQLPSADLDVINFKLEIHNIDILQSIPVPRTDYATETDNTFNQRFVSEEKVNDDYMSLYFNRPPTDDDNKEEKDCDYSKRKLINILEDIRLDDDDTFNIITKVNPDHFQEVDIITKVITKNDHFRTAKNKAVAPIQSEEIEEIDLTNGTSQNIVMPPTQFVDVTQENVSRSSQHDGEVVIEEIAAPRKNRQLQLKNSQEIVRKKVSFELPLSVQEVTDEVDLTKDSETEIINVTNDTINSNLEEQLPDVTDENYMSIKDMILKKHNLDLSPQFVYAKKPELPRRNDDDKVVTSKFFEQTNQTPVCDEVDMDENEEIVEVVEVDNPKEDQPAENDKVDMEIDEAVISTETAMANNSKPVRGLLFTHGPQGLPESLDVSMSTTGFDDGDGDIPHCLDSSLLLSPKANLQPMSGDGNNTESQELPNFLSGFRKTALLFFGQPSAEPNPESSVPAAPPQNQENNFNFDFGGQDKKNKGGLFSFFR